VTIQTGTAVQFGSNDNVGAIVTANASCSSGQLLGGGANIAGNNASRKIAAVTASYPNPDTANTWTVVATVVVWQANGSPPTVTPYALCGS
jgi:hypothetical protein